MNLFPPIVAQVVLAIYAVLLAVGGVMGFVKARSHASLISGLLSALFAVVALVLSIWKNPLGPGLGLLLSICMFILFGYRYAIHNRRFMPSGLIAVVSLVVLLILLMTNPVS